MGLVFGGQHGLSCMTLHKVSLEKQHLPRNDLLVNVGGVLQGNLVITCPSIVRVLPHLFRPERNIHV